MKQKIEIPKTAMDLVGTKQLFSGGLFSRKKDLPEIEYLVKDVRWGSAIVFNKELTKKKHPTIEFLLASKNMKRSQWTTPFPVTEITLPDNY